MRLKVQHHPVHFVLGLKYVPGIKYTDKEWVRLKVRHHPVHFVLGLKYFSGIKYTDTEWVRFKVRHYTLHFVHHTHPRFIGPPFFIPVIIHTEHTLLKA